MSWLIENDIPGVLYNGLNSAKNGTLSGNYTFSGSNTFSGTSTFTGGRVSQVLASSGNTTVTAAMSGSTLLFDAAAGITFTLPTPTAGLTYRFLVTTTVTSSNHKIITNTGTVLMQGVLVLGNANSTSGLGLFQGNGTTHVAVTMNGTTTGGILGSEINLLCLSSTLWEATGTVITTSNSATPFATS